MLKSLVIRFWWCIKYPRYANANGSLNTYFDKCLDIISCFDEFVIRHILRKENEKANALAQQASVYNVVNKYFNIRKSMRIKAESLVLRLV